MVAGAAARSDVETVVTEIAATPKVRIKKNFYMANAIAALRRLREEFRKKADVLPQFCLKNALARPV